jgi:hypothetical protein
MTADGRDPSGFISNPPSVVVKVVGTARNDINGLFGIAISYNIERERYLIHMTMTQSTMALKKENLVKANMMESYRAQWQQLQNDPRVRDRMTQYLTFCQKYVAPLKLSHIVGGVLTVWMILFYLVGFTKTIMTTSMIILLLVIMGPDLVARSPPQTILSNFPERCRVTIEKQMPILRGKLTNRMAIGVVLFLVALCMQSLFFTGGAGAGAKPGTSVSVTTPAAPLLDRPSLEKYYDMGFQDATNEQEHGHLLREEFAALDLQLQLQQLSLEEESSTSDPSFPMDPDNNLLLEEPKSTSLFSKVLNFSNVASIFYLYRTVIDLGTDETTNLFSIGQLAANMQHRTEWWRKGLLALSIYNVLRIFLSLF